MAWLSSWESFIRVVECGSMAAAARLLGCTRAQISKQVGELERVFGARLIERNSRKLHLTPAGEIFLQHARRALEEVQRTELAVRNLGDAPRGTLRISAAVGFGRRYIAPLLPDIVARHPELECELILNDDLVDLSEDNIDLALRMTKAPPEDAIARKLCDLERVICGAPAYVARQGLPLTPQDLLHHQCFSYLTRDQGIWRLRSRDGQETDIPVRARFQHNNSDCILEAVLQGHGLAILPTYVCGEALADGRLLTVLDDYTPDSVFGRHLYACYTPSRVRLPKVRVFLEALENLFQPMPPWRVLHESG